MKLTSALPILVVWAAGCGREAARAGAPADVPGRYVYVGADTTAKIAWAARAELLLAPDSSFEFDLRLRLGDEDERESRTGSYSVRADRLVLRDPAKPHEDFALVIRGDSLVLDAGWIAMAALRLVGVPRPVLVKEGR